MDAQTQLRHRGGSPAPLSRGGDVGPVAGENATPLRPAVRRSACHTGARVPATDAH